MTNVVLLGATGSIGASALSVMRNLGRQYRMLGMSDHHNPAGLAALARKWCPSAVCVKDAADAAEMKSALGRSSVKILHGPEGLRRLACLPRADVVLSAVVGAAGLKPLVAAIRARKRVALANKEPLVMAGSVLMPMAEKCGATILPVDSEHSAIFQCIQGEAEAESPGRAVQRAVTVAGKSVKRILLTASGGPFYRYHGDLSRVTASQALAHPTWKMGRKITVDSATLMNKGIEAIEAHHLFGVPLEKIEIVIHPQSIVHSAVEFADGSILAQMSHPDMRLPIQYALTYPRRVKSPVRPLSLSEIKTLTFASPHFGRFPCLRIALDAGCRGGNAPAALNAANEVAVFAFLDDRVSFTGIARLVDRVLNMQQRKGLWSARPSLDDIITTDSWARLAAGKLLRNI